MGDTHPSERSFKKASQYAKALNDAVKTGDALIGTLTEKQKEQFEVYMTAQREVNVLTDCETSCYVFRHGAKSIMDVLMDSTISIIDQDRAGLPSILAVYYGNNSASIWSCFASQW